MLCVINPAIGHIQVSHRDVSIWGCFDIHWNGLVVVNANPLPVWCCWITFHFCANFIAGLSLVSRLMPALTSNYVFVVLIGVTCFCRTDAGEVRNRESGIGFGDLFLSGRQ